jgi:hypothetical protein
MDPVVVLVLFDPKLDQKRVLGNEGIKRTMAEFPSQIHVISNIVVVPGNQDGPALSYFGAITKPLVMRVMLAESDYVKYGAWSAALARTDDWTAWTNVSTLNQFRVCK